MRKLILWLLAFSFFGCRDQTKTKEKANARDKSSITSINEKTYIPLGGEEQYVEITGTSDKDPVLLFIHGGPGWPQTPHLRYFNADLTKSVILVSWDQAGCGKSYMRNPDPTSITELKIPVYFFVGRHDWSLPAIVTEDFVSRLNAPNKEIVWFEQSGHEPLEEEPAKFNKGITERILLSASTTKTK